MNPTKKIYDQAIKSLSAAKVQIKIHRGTLAEFFEMTNHEFDIIYFDACSPLLSPQQSPLETLKQIFLNKRLYGLSALITNFSEPGNNYNWGQLLATWFATKEFSEVPKIDEDFGKSALEKSSLINEYGQFIEKHLDIYYDKFLTHFIPTLASEIVPMWQFSSMASVQNNHLLNEQSLLKELLTIKEHRLTALSIKELIGNVPHYALAVDDYPLLNWARLINENLPKKNILTQFIANKRKKISIEDSLYICSLLKRFEEADTGFKTFIYNICGDKLKDVITNLDFFDREMRLTCDMPMKNLLIELLIGLYGFPYIAHAGRNMSLKYKAKERWMYSNVFIFDQCRYLYDFLPTLDLWEDFFKNLPNQTIIRGCIDGIRRNHFQLNHQLFKWGFIEDVHSGYGYSNLSERENLNDIG